MIITKNGILKGIKEVKTKNNKDSVVVEILTKTWDKAKAKEIENIESVFYFGKASERALKKTHLVGSPVILSVSEDGRYGQAEPKGMALIEEPAKEKTGVSDEDMNAFNEALEGLKKAEILPEEYEGSPLDVVELIQQAYSQGKRPEEVQAFLKASYKVVESKKYHYLGQAKKKYKNEEKGTVTISVKLPAKPEEEGEWASLTLDEKRASAIKEGETFYAVLGNRFLSDTGRTYFRVLSFKTF